MKASASTAAAFAFAGAGMVACAAFLAAFLLGALLHILAIAPPLPLAAVGLDAGAAAGFAGAELCFASGAEVGFSSGAASALATAADGFLPGRKTKQLFQCLSTLMRDTSTHDFHSR